MRDFIKRIVRVYPNMKCYKKWNLCFVFYGNTEFNRMTDERKMQKVNAGFY